MEKYGWDRYRKEGLQELGNIKESPLFGNKNAQKSFLEIYYQIYNDEKEDQIKATAFYPEKEIKVVAQHRARTVIKDLRKSIDKFYTSPGSVLRYDFDFFFRVEGCFLDRSYFLRRCRFGNKFPEMIFGHSYCRTGEIP